MEKWSIGNWESCFPKIWKSACQWPHCPSRSGSGEVDSREKLLYFSYLHPTHSNLFATFKLINK